MWNYKLKQSGCDYYLKDISNSRYFSKERTWISDDCGEARL